MASDHSYTVKNVKTFQGMEGKGFNATLYHKNKPIAFVIDDASGGALLIQWKDNSAKAPLEEHISPMSIDIFIEKLVNQYLDIQQKKRWCKNATVFRTKNDPEGEYQKAPIPYSPAVKAKLIEEYGDDLEEIVNESIAQ